LVEINDDSIFLNCYALFSPHTKIVSEPNQ